MAKIKTKRERVKFASDNVAGACPEVLEAMIKANEGEFVSVILGDIKIQNNIISLNEESISDEIILNEHPTGEEEKGLFHDIFVKIGQIHILTL